jgi:hypothetical protein
MNIKRKSFSAKISLIGAMVSLVLIVAFIIYGAIYPVYFDLAVIICWLLGAIGLGAYAFVDKKVTEYFGLAAVFLLSFGLGLFFLNSYSVWADWYGHFDMYGSEGGVTPVIIIFVITFIAIVCGIISCFMRKEAEEK